MKAAATTLVALLLLTATPALAGKVIVIDLTDVQPDEYADTVRAATGGRDVRIVDFMTLETPYRRTTEKWARKRAKRADCDVVLLLSSDQIPDGYLTQSWVGNPTIFGTFGSARTTQVYRNEMPVALAVIDTDAGGAK